MKTLLVMAALTLGGVNAQEEGVMHCTELSAVDGDSVYCDRAILRDMGSGEPYEYGYDAPELFHPQCEEERLLALKSKARMNQLVHAVGVQVVYSGRDDRYGRPLVWVYLRGGMPVGDVLVREGLARFWEYGKPKGSWCSR